ncbi:hypothetical protein NRC85_004029 [Vibrio parahaemolyticus]|nr:hypothetical protein [Vibrio parahaemolyticus]
MLAATIFDIMHQAQIDECNVKFRMVNSTPTVVIQFIKDGAKSTDKENIQKLRSALATPLFKQYQVTEEIDGLIIADLGHVVEQLSDGVKSLLSAQAKATSKPQKSNKSRTGTSTPQEASTAVSSESTESSPEKDSHAQDSNKVDPFSIDMSRFEV